MSDSIASRHGAQLARPVAGRGRSSRQSFAILLVMAHQNESNTSDMGSSFREDPYGTSLLFDSFAACRLSSGPQPGRGLSCGSERSKTTAFFMEAARL